ncbi:hypothetical protein, partial [Thermaurantiacus sp.]
MKSVLLASALALAIPAHAATFTWTGGAYVSGVTSPNPLLSPDIFELATGSTKSLSGGVTFTNQTGTVVWQDGQVNFNSGGAVINNSLWDAKGDNLFSSGSGPAGSFTNNGTFRKSGGAGVTQISQGIGFSFVNNGIIDAEVGTIRFTTNFKTFNAGTVFSGDGNVDISGSSAFNGGFTSSNLTILSGTQTGTSAALTGTATMLDGNLAGSWAVASGATLNLSSTAGKVISGVSFTNDGTVNWSGGTASINSGVAAVNNGLWDATSDNALTSTGGPASTFTNQGTLRKSAGAGETYISSGVGLTFINTGLVEVLSGTIRVPNGWTNNGTLAGTGTFRNLTTLTNAGTVAPGALGSIGTLSLSGNYAQGSAGALAIQLASSSAFDLFRISGTAALNGTLALSCILGCAIATGDSFVILDSDGILSGTFSNVTLAGFLADFDYSLDYDTVNRLVRLNILFAGTPVDPGGG